MKKIIGKQVSRDGRTRFYVLPIETEAGFYTLMQIVKEECDCMLSPLDKGPGILVQKASNKDSTFIFVLSDSTGLQFFAENENDVGIAEIMATIIEKRIQNDINLRL